MLTFLIAVYTVFFWPWRRESRKDFAKYGLFGHLFIHSMRYCGVAVILEILYYIFAKVFPDSRFFDPYYNPYLFYFLLHSMLLSGGLGVLSLIILKFISNPRWERRNPPEKVIAEWRRNGEPLGIPFEEWPVHYFLVGEWECAIMGKRCKGLPYPDYWEWLERFKEERPGRYREKVMDGKEEYKRLCRREIDFRDDDTR